MIKLKFMHVFPGKKVHKTVFAVIRSIEFIKGVIALITVFTGGILKIVSVLRKSKIPLFQR